MEETLKRALHAGGDLLMSRFSNRHKVHRKEDLSNVRTETDLQSGRKIRDIIQSAFPAHNLLDEEIGLIDNGSDYTWIIDPLDGTSNYISGLPWFGVLVAVAKSGVIKMAGARLPYSGDDYFAELGKGAYRNGERIAVSSEKKLGNAIISHSMDYPKNENTFEKALTINRLLVRHTRNIRSTNSLVELCYTADGRLQGSINLSTMLWDIAAPALIIQEAGGIVSDITGNDIRFNPLVDHRKTHPIVAANAILHQKIIELINRGTGGDRQNDSYRTV